MADNLFLLIPFPRVLHFCACNGNLSNVEENWMKVLCVCIGFSKVQGLPAEVHIEVMQSSGKVGLSSFKSLPNVKSVDLSGCGRDCLDWVTLTYQATSYFTSLSELTLPYVGSLVDCRSLPDSKQDLAESDICSVQ